MDAIRRTPWSWWLLAALSFTGYLILPFWFPLPARYNVAPLADIFTFTPDVGAGALYGGWLLAQSVLFFLGYRLVGRRPVSPLLIGGAALLFALPLLLTFPVNATDIYRYFIRGRIGGVYGANPFVTPPSGFPQDPFLPLAGEWVSFTSPYGPLWEVAAGAISRLAGDGLLAALLAFKGVGLIFFLGVGGLLWRALDDRPPARRRQLLLLWLWHPALLLTFVVNGHNDVVMMWWLVLGWLLMRRNRPVAGWLVALSGPLTKPIGVLALPFLLVEGWRRSAPEASFWDWRSRGRFLTALLLGSPLLATAAFLPFGNPLDLVVRLLREAGEGAGFSPLTLLILADRAEGPGWPLSLYSTTGALLTGLGAILLFWRVLRGRAVPRSAADLFGLYILLALNFRIWYAAWLFPWLLLDRPGRHTRARRLGGTLFLLTAQFSVLIYAHVRTLLLDGSQLGAHVWGVGLTFGVPLLAAGVSAVRVASASRRCRRSHRR